MQEKNSDSDGNQSLEHSIKSLHSEYETASEWDPDFQSDNEPPADKVHEERLLVKRKDIRLYKKIIKLGKRGDMPSKYNKIRYRFTKFDKETLDTEKLKGEEILDHQMGIDIEELDELKLLCLQNMKKNEISSFRVEVVGFNKKKASRFLAEEYWLQFEVFDWETIIDVNGDFQCMKHVLKKGKGIERLKQSDESIMSLILVSKATEKVLLTKNFKDGGIVYDQLPKSIGGLVLYLKEGEECKIDIKMDYFLENETDSEFMDKIKEENSKNPDIEYPFSLHISLKTIITNDDIFYDKTVLKKKIFSSYSTSKPDAHSRIYFDFQIKSQNPEYSEELIHNGLKNMLKTMPKDDDNFPMFEASTCEKHFLDTYSLSRALRHSLRNSKKLEQFKLVISDINKIKDGYDRRLVNKWAKDKGIDDVTTLLPLEYTVKIYTFSVGDNCFTMGLADKQKCWKDRRPIFVKLLKSKQWKRAKKMLIFLQEIIESVS